MYGCYQIIPKSEANHANSVSQWWFYISPYTRILDFIVGCFIAQLYFKTPKILSSKAKLLATFCCVLSVAAITCLFDIYTSGTDFVYVLAMTYGYTPFLGIVLLYCAKILIIKNNNISKMLLLLGNCSFSLYLLQELLLRRIGFYKPNADELFSIKFIFIFLAYILAMTFISIFVFKYIEAYTKVLMKRILNNPKRLFRNRIPEFM